MTAPANREHEFALKVRRALDECAADLPAATTDRLAVARRLRSRASPKPRPCRCSYRPRRRGRCVRHGAREPPAGVVRAPPAARVAAGPAARAVGIAYWEDMQRTAELADIDAAMLSDDLPLNAYLDHGFNAYLSRAH